MTGHLLSADFVSRSYVDLRSRVIELLRDNLESADLSVPHCPDWTVRQTVSHMVGVNEDVLSGNMAGVTTEAWTQAQVDRHSSDSLAELLDRWESLATEIDALSPHFPEPINHQFVFDATMHEHDIRCALGDTGARDSGAIVVAKAFLLNMLDRQPRPAVRELMQVGVVDFDWVRSLTGRRSLEQIASCGLDPDAVALIISGMPVEIPPVSILE